MAEQDDSQELGHSDLLAWYKIVEENHRFYVDKRFTVISVYFPAMTLLTSILYALSDSHLRLGACVLGVLVTVLLYAIERRNWILSNACLNAAETLVDGRQLKGDVLCELRKADFCRRRKGKTFLDPLFPKWMTQHRIMCLLTVVLVLSWVCLGAVTVFWPGNCPEVPTGK